jgi:hypothetical protein
MPIALIRAKFFRIEHTGSNAAGPRIGRHMNLLSNYFARDGAMRALHSPFE